MVRMQDFPYTKLACAGQNKKDEIALYNLIFQCSDSQIQYIEDKD